MLVQSFSRDDLLRPALIKNILAGRVSSPMMRFMDPCDRIKNAYPYFNSLANT